MELRWEILMPSRDSVVDEAARRHPLKATWADTPTPHPPMMTGAVKPPPLAGRVE